MSKIGLSYDSADAIPSDLTVADLFTEQDGKFVLTGVDGMKSQADIDRLNEALRKEKNDHKGAKEALGPLKEWLGDRNTDDIQAALDELETLKARVDAGQGGEVDEEKLNTLAERIAGQKYGPVQRNLDTVTKKLADAEALNLELQTKITNGVIKDALTSATAELKVQSSAAPDVVLIGTPQFEVQDDGSVIHKESGLDAKAWLTDQKEHRPYWWANSVGGGAGGGDGTGGVNGGAGNPWSNKGWNITAQGQYIKEHGMEKAETMARAAGTTATGAKPAPRS